MRGADVLVLGYHGVSDTWRWRFSVTPAALRAQVGRLLARGYRAATFSDAVAATSGRWLAVTFDDGYGPSIERARAVLGELGVPATVFVVAGEPAALARAAGEEWLGTSDEAELEPLAPERLRALAADGWEIGAHSCTHPPLTTLADDELARELRESRERVEDWLGRACSSFAYPYGDHDERVVEATRAAGYGAAAVFPPSFPRPTPLAWPRVGVYREDGPGAFALKTSRLGRAARRLLRG